MLLTSIISFEKINLNVMKYSHPCNRKKSNDQGKSSKGMEKLLEQAHTDRSSVFNVSMVLVSITSRRNIPDEE